MSINMPVTSIKAISKWKHINLRQNKSLYCHTNSFSLIFQAIIAHVIVEIRPFRIIYSIFVYLQREKYVQSIQYDQAFQLYLFCDL